MARRRQVDVIVVWRLDRWGSSLSDLMHSLEELRAIGVDFASVTEGLDFSTPTGRAMAGMLAIFAQFEREVLRERVLAGLGRLHIGRASVFRALSANGQESPAALER
jgi:putative DNA-invertase from lambdoid prophage Rac